MLASPFFSVLLCHLIPVTDNKKGGYVYILCDILYRLWNLFSFHVSLFFSPSLLDLLIWSCDKMMSLLIVAVIWFFSPFPNSQFYRKRRYIFRPLYFLFLAEVPFFFSIWSRIDRVILFVPSLPRQIEFSLLVLSSFVTLIARSREKENVLFCRSIA